MTSFGKITDQLFDQCLNVLGGESNQRKLKDNLIDPLVTYFKQRLRYFFVVITLLLCMILVANFCLIYQFMNLKKTLSPLMASMSSIKS